MNDINTLRAYKDVFGSQQGKTVLEDMKDAHFFYSITFQSANQLLLAYNEGQRSVILRILRLLEVQEEHYVRSRDNRTSSPSNRFSTTEQRNAAADALYDGSVGHIDSDSFSVAASKLADEYNRVFDDLDKLLDPAGDWAIDSDKVVRQPTGPDKDGPERNEV